MLMVLSWCLNYEKVHQYLPDVLKEQLTIEGANTFTVEMFGASGK